MARTVTVTFDDGSSHVYENIPDNITPDQVESRASGEFGKSVTAIDGGRAATAPTEQPKSPDIATGMADRAVQYAKDNRYVRDAAPAELSEMTTEQLRNLPVPTNPLREALGAITEPISSIATSIVAKPVSEAAALASIPVGIAATELGYPGAVDAEAVKRSVFDTLHDSPETAAGSSPYNPINAVMNGLGAVVNSGADFVVDDVLGIENETARAGAKEGVMQGLGFVGVKGAVKPTGSVIDRFFGSSTRRAQDIGRETLNGGVKPVVTVDPVTGTRTVAYSQAEQNIRNAATGRANNQTAAEAAGVDASAQFAGLEQLAREARPDLYGVKGMEGGNITATQAARMNAPVNKLAGGASQEAMIASQNAAKTVLNETLDPLRQQSLGAANTANRVLNEVEPQLTAAQEAARLAQVQVGTWSDVGKRQLAKSALGYPGPLGKAMDAADSAKVKAGQSAEQAAIASTLEGKIGDLASNGLTRLTGDNVISTIHNKLTTPGVRASSLVNRVLNRVEQKIKDAAERNGGTLDAHDLHSIRKFELNEIIERFSKNSAASSKKLATKEMQAVKNAIDESIVKAAGKEGPKWKSYLERYSMGMRDIERKEFARQFDKLSDADKIAVAKGNKPEFLEKIFGDGNTGLRSNLGQQADVYTNVGKKLETKAQLGIRSKAAGEALRQTIKKNTSYMNVPNMLNTKAVVANTALDLAQAKMSKSVERKLATAMQSPSKFIELLDQLPIAERAAALKMLQSNKGAFLAGQGMMTGAEPPPLIITRGNDGVRQ